MDIFLIRHSYTFEFIVGPILSILPVIWAARPGANSESHNGRLANVPTAVK